MKTEDLPALVNRLRAFVAFDGGDLADVEAAADEIERLQAERDAAVAAERERCAKLCEQTDEDGEGPDCWGWHSKDYARAIRGA